MENLLEHPAEKLILLFLFATFLQSGLDKVMDWKGNLSFISGHFQNSPLKNSVPFLLGTITIMELLSALLMGQGLFQMFNSGESQFALYGTMLAALTLIFLLIGQRLAKDYAGAMTLAVYFIIAVFGVFLLNLNIPI